MHILLMPQGSSRDVNPFIGIGRELARRGHDVTVSTNGYFEDVVTGAGLRFQELGEAELYLRMIQHPDLWHPTRGPRFVLGSPETARGIREGYEQVVEFHRQHPDGIVVAATLAIAGRVALETHPDLKLVSAHLQPTLFRSLIDPPMLGSVRVPSWLPSAGVAAFYWCADQVVDFRILRRLTWFRKELGLPKQRRYLDKWIHSPKLTLALFPDWFGDLPDWNPEYRRTGFIVEDGTRGLPDGLVEWLDAGPEPVAFCFGSAMAQGERLFRAAVQASEIIGCRGILLTRYADQLPRPLPANIRHEPYVSLTDLLPRVTAFVHHGGIGSTARGLFAGKPQVVTPLSHDQFDNARRVARLGAGVQVIPKRNLANKLAAALRQVTTDPEFRSRCQFLSQRDTPSSGIQATADAIESLI